MGLIENWVRRNQPDWCRDCKCAMEKADKQLYALPSMMVGHFVCHEDPEYYREDLHLVDKKADIPPGMYACGAFLYRCPGCGRRVTILDLFLPVRNEEKHDGVVVFKQGELDDILWD